MKTSTQWRLIAVAFAASAAMSLANAHAIASSAPTKTTTGICHNSATWSLTQTRQGTKVTSSITIKGMPARSTWNINWAYNPINTVKNHPATATSKGTMTFKDVAYSAKPLTAYIWVDEPWAYTMTCIISGTI